MNKTIFLFLALLSVLVLAGCAAQQAEVKETTESTEAKETVFKIGAIQPLTGEGAAYGVPVQKVTQQAVADLNTQWKDKNMRLEVVYEDGKCNGKDALSAAQKLVNLEGVKVIYGGVCSGETLGFAPFTEDNQVLVFSALSSSPEITTAGDYVFRNYPSDTAQVAAMIDFIKEKGYSTIALLSENTDYAQALRNSYLEQLPGIGVEIVADEVIAPNAKDVRTEVAKIKNANSDAYIILPQTVPTAGIFAKQLFEANLEGQGLGNDVAGLDETQAEYGTELEGFYYPASLFEKEDSEEFATLKEQTECELGFYCATTYDGIFLLGEILEECGDSDTDCLRDKLYATQDWEGKLSGTTSFDESGDVGGSFEIKQVETGSSVIIS